MGDTSHSVAEEIDAGPKAQESVTNALRPVKPSENIAISSDTSLPSEEELKKVHQTVESEENVRGGSGATENTDTDKKPEPEKPTTDLPIPAPSDEKLAPTSDQQPPTPIALDKNPRGGSAAADPNQNDRLLRNQSDIFSLKEQTSVSSSIFSINGSPSRKVSRKRDTTVPLGGQLSEPPSDASKAVSRDKLRDRDSYNDTKRPTSSLRNPLTGTGLSSNDEYRFKSSKRKDGNPLLGLGYDPEVVPSGHRIPPGGYSHKLW